MSNDVVGNNALDDFLAGLEGHDAAVALRVVQQPKRYDKIAIGFLYQPILNTGVLTQTTFRSLWDFAQHDRRDRDVLVADVIDAITPYIPQGRNDLCRRFLRTTADWFLMVDWDITFSPQDVYKLLDDADPEKRPIISGCYVTRLGEDNKIRVCWLHEENGVEFSTVRFKRDEIIECTSVGMGFTLIHRSVLLKVADQNKHDPWKWFGQDNLVGAHVGEDLTFCSRARRAGFTVWGHGGVLLGHTKTTVWTVADLAPEELDE
jgi:hypothetical protein